MNTGSESGGAAGPPASPMRKRVASICAGGASGAVAGPALTVVAWPHPSSPMHRNAKAVSRHAGGVTLPYASSRSEERREGKSVDLGGRRIIKKKKKKRHRTDTLAASHKATSTVHL